MIRPSRRDSLRLAAGLAAAGWFGPARPGGRGCGLAMHGVPALAPGFSHLRYANPNAPKGGRLVLGLVGTFDSLNPLIVKGVAPDAAPRFVWQSLLARSLDEPFTLYPLLARAVDLTPDRARLTFHLDPSARFADGAEVTSDDVRATFEALRAEGRPFHRASFGTVAGVDLPDRHTIRFDLAGTDDREVPLLVGLMPVLPAAAVAERFAETSLAPPPGSGPYRMVEVRPGERITLARRPDFWAADLPTQRGLFNFDEIRYDFYRDANTLFEAFRAGLYDFRVETDPARWVTGYDFPAVTNGRIRREALPLATPKGMTGLVFNTRRPAFADVRVREALGFAFDFRWVNRSLYLDTLKRTGSYFEGSDLSSLGRAATDAERALLAPFAGAVRTDVLEGAWAPPSLDGSGRDRHHARRALRLLDEAGFELVGGQLRERRTGIALAFEIMVLNRAQERLALSFAHSLGSLGIEAGVRLVDEVQYWRRLSAFDFDMVQWTWAASPSPGNEQRNRWSAEAADTPGSLNYAGARSPAIDAMIDAMLAAETRDGFVAAVRALDRLLLSGFYAVPLFHIPDQWIAYDAALRRPAATPLFGLPVELWWREA